MVTGTFDSNSILQNQELDQKCEEQRGEVADVQACHIFGESMTQGRGGSATLDEVCIVAASRIPRCLRHSPIARMSTLPLLLPFSRTLASEVLPMNSLRMACIILETFCHSHPRCISSLITWACGLKPPKWCVVIGLLTGTNLTCAQPNCYSVCVYHTALERTLTLSEHLRQDHDRFLVTFSSSNKRARLPNRQLLALHAVCARVAHLSGAFQVIDELEDVEETSARTFDGSFAHLLDHPIAPFTAVPGVVQPALTMVSRCLP